MLVGKEIVDELDEAEDLRDLAHKRRELLMKRNVKRSGGTK